MAYWPTVIFVKGYVLFIQGYLPRLLFRAGGICSIGYPFLFCERNISKGTYTSEDNGPGLKSRPMSICLLVGYLVERHWEDIGPGGQRPGGIFVQGYLPPGIGLRGYFLRDMWGEAGDIC